MAIICNDDNITYVSFNLTEARIVTFNSNPVLYTFPRNISKSCRYKQEGLFYDSHVYIDDVLINPNNESRGTFYVDVFGNVYTTSADDRRAVSFKISLSSIYVRTYTVNNITYEEYDNTAEIWLGNNLLAESIDYTNAYIINPSTMGQAPKSYIPETSWTETIRI